MDVIIGIVGVALVFLIAKICWFPGEPTVQDTTGWSQEEIDGLKDALRSAEQNLGS